MAGGREGGIESHTAGGGDRVSPVPGLTYPSRSHAYPPAVLSSLALRSTLSHSTFIRLAPSPPPPGPPARATPPPPPPRPPASLPSSSPCARHATVAPFPAPASPSSHRLLVSVLRMPETAPSIHSLNSPPAPAPASRCRTSLPPNRSFPPSPPLPASPFLVASSWSCPPTS